MSALVGLFRDARQVYAVKTHHQFAVCFHMVVLDNSLPFLMNLTNHTRCSIYSGHVLMHINLFSRLLLLYQAPPKAVPWGMCFHVTASWRQVSRIDTVHTFSV